jgi:predicted dehydrogenase
VYLVSALAAPFAVACFLGPCLKIKQIIDSGLIGYVVNINHTEPVGYSHFAHSFVRGNWHNEKQSSFSLLAKCCHDIDLIINWMKGKKCINVSSFGSLFYFKEKNAPQYSGTHCLTCSVEKSCPYSAKKNYLDSKISPSNWPCSVVLESEILNVLSLKEENEADIEDLFNKLTEQDKFDLLEKCLRHEDTLYGRCAFRIKDNDVCDNQVVNMEFEDGSTATLTMIAFSKDQCIRKTKIYGTLGELEWDDSKIFNKIMHSDFSTKQTHLIDCETVLEADSNNKNESSNIKLSGHGGSDYYFMHSFIEACIKDDKSLVLTDFEDSFQSHLIVFAAEYSRLNKKIVNLDEFLTEK